ncbi:mycothione reductase [Rhodococcus sp. NPDC056960]|uniref:mycothione reductase n=1 Tax=Rhodococcus sp. NPDC056960 TaxID=3345982 RepID=UPI003631458F
MTHFDLAIVGSGSGNSLPDDRFADKTIAILEEGTYGGTCLNVGCIPTKMFVYAAEVARTVTGSAKYGIDAQLEGVRWPDIVKRVFGRIDPISAGGERYRAEDSPNTTLFRGHATFVGPRTLDTGTGEMITADQVVIAAGSRPIIPDVVRESGVRFYTNEDIMRLPELPERMVIIGAGFIAAEFAHVFSALGTRVSLIARGSHLLRHLDEDISHRFTDLAEQKWDVHRGHSVAAVRPDGDGVAVELADGSVVSGDVLLVATGRQPNGDTLSVAAAGVELDDEGRVVVDEFQRTTAEGVFALGDVSSPYQLKHVANHEARVVQHNLLQDAWKDTSGLRSTDHRFVPAAVFTDPQIAHVGLTEAEAREAGWDLTVKVQAYGDVAYGWAMEDNEGLCKVVAERGTGRLLGAHVIGAQAPTVIQPLIQAMSFGVTAQRMARGQYWIHPALPEVVENALLGLDLPSE